MTTIFWTSWQLIQLSRYQTLKSMTPAASQTTGWYMQTWLFVYQPLASSHRRFGTSRRLFRRRSRLFSGSRCFSHHLPPPSTRSQTRWSTFSQMSLTRLLRSSDALIIHQNRSRSGFSMRRSLQSVNVVGLRGSGSPHAVKVTASATVVLVIAQIDSSTSHGVCTSTKGSVTAPTRDNNGEEFLHSSDHDLTRTNAENQTLCMTFSDFCITKIRTIKLSLIAKSHPSFFLPIFQIFHSLALHLTHFLLSPQPRFLNSSISLAISHLQ